MRSTKLDFIAGPGPVRVRFFVVLALSLTALAVFLSAGCGGRFDKGVLAMVGSEPITVEDFRLAASGKVPNDFKGRMDILNNLINYKTVSKAAIKAGVMSDPEVYSRVEGFYVEKLPDYLRKKIADETTVTDDELLMNKPVLPTAFVVAFMVTPSVDKAEKALAEVKKGSDFVETATKNSIAVVGDKEITLDDSFYPAGIRAVLNGLKPGDTSPIMKMEMGYAIFRMKERKDPEALWNAKKEGLRQEIKAQKAKKEMADLLDKLRGSADIKIEKKVLPGGEVQYTGAVVNGTGIWMDPSIFNKAGDPHAPHETMNAKTLRDALNSKINNFLLSQEAQKRGLQADPAFKRALELKREEIISGIYLEKVRGEVVLTSHDVQDYYNKNKGMFARDASVRVSRIVVGTEDEAGSVLKELKSGRPFEQIARERSADRVSGEKGGDVGFVSPEELKEPLKSTLLKLKPGDTSGIVKSDYGFEILKVAEVRPGRVPELSDIAETVSRRALLVKQSEKVEAVYKAMYREAGVRVNQSLLKSMK